MKSLFLAESGGILVALLMVCFVCVGCSYGVKQAVRDAKSTQPSTREKALHYLTEYLSKTTGQKGDEQQRRRVIRAVGKTRLPQAVGPLRMVLMHETQAPLRKEAIRALGVLRAASALQELREALRKDRDFDVRMLAAATLGRIGDKRALQDLIRSLTDPQPAVRMAAVRAVMALGPQRAIPKLIDRLCDSNPDVVEAASKALIRVKKQALSELLIELQSRNARRRQCVVAFFPRLGTFARAPLIKAFAKKPSRVGATEALHKLTGDTTSWPVFAKIIDKPDTYDGRTDLLTFKQTGTLTTLHAAFALWYVVPFRYRMLFRDLLGKIARKHGEKGREVLSRAALSGPDLAYRTTAVIAIGDTGPKSLGVLRSFLQSPTRALVVSAMYGLGKVGKEGLPDLEKFLKSQDEGLRLMAVRAISQIKDPQAKSILLASLKDKAAKIRMEALKGMALQQDKSAILPVRNMLSDPIIDVVMTAIQTLIKLGDTRNVNMYIQALRRGPYPPKPAFVRTLGQLGDKRALPLLKKLAKRYLRDWKAYRKKAMRLYRRGLRRVYPQTEKAKKQLRRAIKDKLKEHDAVSPTALCAFFETLNALIKFGYSTHEMFSKIGGQLSVHFNPLSRPVDQCPWPSFRANQSPTIKP